MKTSFRVTQLIIFLLFSVLVLFFSFSTHLGSREEQSRVVFVAKFPAFINSGDSKKDLKIDDERRTLRLIERFNLMEESFGENWTNIYSTNPLLECTIGRHFCIDYIKYLIIYKHKMPLSFSKKRICERQ